MAGKFRKMRCLNVYGRKRGRVGVLSLKIQSFSSKHKLHLFDPPVYEIDCFNTDQVMSKSCLYYLSVSKYISKVLCHLSTFCG